VTDLGSSPCNEKPTIPAPASEQERELEFTLAKERRRKRRKAEAEPVVLAWMAAELKGNRS
jgi:hypothetical protein